MIRSIKESKEEAHKEKENYFTEIQNILRQKSEEINVYRAEY